MAPDLLQICNIAEPATGLEGKFSLRATAAMALLGDDTADMAAFNDARMRDRDLVAMRDRVVVIPDEAYATTRTKVVVVTHTGAMRTRPRTTPDDPPPISPRNGLDCRRSSADSPRRSSVRSARRRCATRSSAWRRRAS